MKTILTIIFLLFSLNAFGATYYMRSDGTDADSDCSESSACCAGAMDVTDFNGDTASLQAGDTVWVCDTGGVFSAKFVPPVSGSNGSPILIKAYTGHTPTITVAGTNHGIEISGKDYITIDGITITDFLARGIYVLSSQNVILQNNTISGGNGAAPDHGINVTHANGAALEPGIEIKNNSISSIDSGITSGTDSWAVSSTAILIQGVDAAVVSENTITSTDSIGIAHVRVGGSSVNSTDIIIEKNDVSGTFGPNILVQRTTDAIIRYNKGHDSSGGGISNSFNANGTMIYSNLIYNNTMIANLVSYNGIDVNQDSDDGFIYNNIIYNVPRHSLMIDDDGGASDGWTIKNNIFDASANTDIGGIGDKTRKVAIGIRDADAVFTADYNILRGQSYESDGDDDPASTTDTWVGSIGDGSGTLYNFADWKTNSSGDANSLDSDPIFNNVTANNFSLQSTSPAINAGTDLGATYDDALSPGSIWPGGVSLEDQDKWGSGWEIGAYVFITGTIRGVTLQGATIQ